MTARAAWAAVLVLALVAGGLGLRYWHQVRSGSTWCYQVLAEGLPAGTPQTLDVRWRPWRDQPLDHALAAALVARDDFGAGGGAFVLDRQWAGFVVVRGGREDLAVLTAGACREDGP